jgi:ABC-type transporter Mla subunit MlaD
MRRIITGIAVLLIVGSTFGSMGCSGKAAATAAVGTAQTAFDAVKDQAMKVMPEETQKVSDAIAAAKTDIDQGKFTEAMEAAKTLPEQVKQLADQASKKKDELTANWTSMSAELPKAVDAVQQKVDALSKMKKLPAGLDATKFEGIKTALVSAKQSWADAQTAFQAGNLADAMGKVGTIKQTVVEAMTTLGLTVPPTLQAS